jgi:hypothetical protein
MAAVKQVVSDERMIHYRTVVQDCTEQHTRLLSIY